jgi:hypothetical protein
VCDTFGQIALKIIVDRTTAWGHWTAKNSRMNKLSCFMSPCDTELLILGGI